MLRSVILLFALAACGTPAPPKDAQTVADCLVAEEAKMYGAFWCPHCKRQKEEFGTAFPQAIYIECSNDDYSQNDTCKAAHIAGYPTWEFKDGSRLTGEQTLANLAAKAGCGP